MANADKLKRMPFTSEPEHDESFMGYLLRLTEKNRGETPSWLLSKARINSYVRARLNFVFDNSLDFSPLAALTGTGEDKLKTLPYQPAAGVRRRLAEYLFFGLPVYQCLIRPRRPKICPGCLREFGYIKKVWEFALVTACPSHKCLLLDECPGCGKPISWIRRRVSVCRCDFDWRECHPAPVPDSEYEVTRQVHSLCGLPGGDDPRGNAKIVGSPLYRLGLQSFSSALIFVASQFAPVVLTNNRLRYVDMKGKNFGRSHTNAEAHAMLHRALAVFEDWPKNYYSFLDERRAENDPTGSKPARRNPFRRYQSSLFLRLPESDFGFVRSAFREYRRVRRFETYVAHYGDANKPVEEDTKNTAASPNVSHITVQGQLSGGVSELFETHVSGNKACKALGIRWPAAEKLIAAGTLKAVVGRSGGYRSFFIEKTSLESLKSKLERSSSLRGVVGLIGLHAERIKELVECGLLNPLRGPGVDGSGDWRFDRAEVASLIDRLAGKAPKKRKVDERKFVDFMFALKKVSSAGVGLGTFLHAILEGEIKPVGKTGGIGLRCLLFSEKQVAHYARNEFRLLAGDAMTLSEVAKALGVGEGAINFIVRKGILRAEKLQGLPLSRTFVKRDELDAFNENYLSASKLASEHRTGPNHLVKSLAARGVRPVTGSKIDGGYMYLYRKADVAPLDVAALVAEGRTSRLIILRPPRTIPSEKEAKASARPRKCRYYRPPPILNETQAAEILGIDVETLRQLVEGGALKPHNRLPRAKRKGGEHCFSQYTVEKYKNRAVDHTGLVSFTTAAKMLNLRPDNFHKRYIKTGRLRPTLDGVRRGDHFFSLKDVEALAEMDKQTILTPEAAEILGIPTSTVNNMIANGELTPFSGPKIDGYGHYLLLRNDVEKLRKEREAFKAERIKKGKTARYGRGPRHPRPTIPEIISPRIAQLIALRKRQGRHRPISGRELHQQLVREGRQVGIASVQVALRKIRQQHASDP